MSTIQNNVAVKGTCTFKSDDNAEVYVVTCIAKDVRDTVEYEVWLNTIDGQLVSAYKEHLGEEYCYQTKKAKEVADIIHKLSKAAKPKSAIAGISTFGASAFFEIKTKSYEAHICKYFKAVVECDFSNAKYELKLTTQYMIDELNQKFMANQIAEQLKSYYVKLGKRVTTEEFKTADSTEYDYPDVSLQEVALTKDLRWLADKKYYIIQNESEAEKIFNALENFDGIISYDVETTGTRMNMFSRAFGKRHDELINYNMGKDTKITADTLTGFSFSVAKDTAYYFPCAQRKFKNLYEDKNEPVTKQICERIKSLFVIGPYRNETHEEAEYIRKTPIEEWTPDIILMERCRYILEKKKILAFNAVFEYKTGLIYDIDTNIVEDPMLLHKFLYCYKRKRVGVGESSKLKYLSKVELGVDQLDLQDFFPDYSEDRTGLTRAKSSKGKKKSRAKIDFSYMSYENARWYAPADADLARLIGIKYKQDMMENYPEMEFIYGVEVLMACAIGYSEFYGLRINENKIEDERIKNMAETVLLEEQVRNMNKLDCAEEQELVRKLNVAYDAHNMVRIDQLTKELREFIDKRDNFNIASPKQVADLFYDKYQLTPDAEGKKSVSKTVLKQLIKEINSDGTLKYPDIDAYSKYKAKYTLDTKFFGKLLEFSYPGGYMFPSFGGYTTATGRMSASKPNSQQMPKSITKIIEPRENCVFVDADFSQIEYRILVGEAGQTNLIDYFKDPDADYHSKMASLMFQIPYAKVDIPDASGKSPRSQSKGLNFGIPYGMGIKSLAILLFGKCDSFHCKLAQERYDMYFREQPKVKEFFERVKQAALQTEYTRTHFGRRRYYSFTDKDGRPSEKYKAMALRQAGNAVIQGSAADAFKIAMTRIFTWIRANKLFGKVYMSNYIHDEGLYEIDVTQVNCAVTLANIITHQQLQVEGWPKLLVGAGVGKNWAEAKGGMAEIHPLLSDWIVEHAGEINCGNTPSEVYACFENINRNFRKNRIINYIKEEQIKKNNGEVITDISPVMAKLMNLAFEGGIDKEVEEASATLSDAAKEKLNASKDVLRLKRFMEQNSEEFKDATYDWLDSITGLASTFEEVEDEEEGYEDSTDEEGNDLEYIQREFTILKDDMEFYGVSMANIIYTFKFVISEERKICGICVDGMTKTRLEELAAVLDRHQCNQTDAGALEVVLVGADRKIQNLGIYVRGLTVSEIAVA